MICSKCEHKVPDDSEFCQYCGNKIESQQVTENLYIEESLKNKVDKNNKNKKQISKKVVIIITSISLAIIMLTIPIFFFIFHSHDYRSISYIAPTCTISGNQTFECSRCKHSYIEVIQNSHQYTIIEQKDSTCDSKGFKTLKCSACNDTFTEPIQEKPHNYSDATCTKPQICSSCGNENGIPLGHTDNVECVRCGEITFETLSYSGNGVGNVTGINLPKGKYNFIITHSGESSFYVYFNNKNIIIEYGNNVSYVHQYTSTGLTDGYFNITKADSHWTITIEAIGNND